MRALFVLLALVLTVAHGPHVPAQEPETDIPAVIEDQIAAFKRNDTDAAWAHASPQIQGLFGDAERFCDMVRKGYPMVWRPRSYRMGELEAVDGGFLQSVLFQDQTGRFFVAVYEMRLIDGAWRIDGVHVREAPGRGV